MHQLTEKTICCPYCGELLMVMIDSSEAGQEYIEDCQVCCQPIVFTVALSELEEPLVSVRSENETF